MIHGVPGIGGSLGKCCYCGDNFMKEIVLGKSVRTITLGGEGMAVHGDCWTELDRLSIDGRIEFKTWREMPEASPLRLEFIRLEKERWEELK